MDTWEIEARAEIDVLFADYIRWVDGGKPELLAELFTEDCVYDMDNDNVARGRAEIPERVGALLPVFAGAVNFGRIRHHTSSVRVEFLDRERAKASTYFMAVSRQGPDHWGIYRDLIVRTGAGWRFAERSARVEGAVQHSPMRVWFTG